MRLFSSHTSTPGPKLPVMALAALVVAIVSALLAAGALLQSVLSFRRSGWRLDVTAWWDTRLNVAHVEITNVGRQSCVISEIRYFISDRANPSSLPFSQVVFFDHDAVTEPIAPSAKIELDRSFEELPEAFNLEVWAWTAGRPYKSEKWVADPRTVERR